MTPEQEFIFDNTGFGYFFDSPTTNWLNAQLNCNSSQRKKTACYTTLQIYRHIIYVT